MQGKSDWHSEIFAFREGVRFIMSKNCTHLNQIRVTTTDIRVCEACIKAGDTWVHLRLCLTCGVVAMLRRFRKTVLTEDSTEGAIYAAFFTL